MLQHLTDIFPRAMDLASLTQLVVSAFIVYWIAAIVAVFIFTFHTWGRWIPFISAVLWFLPWALSKMGQAEAAKTLDPACRLIFPILVVVTLCLMWKGRHWLERVLFGASAIMTVYFLCKLLGLL